MKNYIIFRLEWNYSKQESAEKVRIKLNHLNKYILPNLMNQTNGDYRCFIEYPKPLSSEIQQSKMIVQGHPIVFVPKLGTKDGINTWVKRYLLSRIEAYIKTLKLTANDRLIFISLPMESIYSFNTVDFFKSYNGKEKMIRFKKGYYVKGNKAYPLKSYDEFEGFAFVCTLKEYMNYFSVYNSIKGFNYSEFKDFPTIYTDKVEFLILPTSENSIPVNNFIN
nr:hypothetical protein [uncultured Cellulosilyticum sp.]